jgi:hypothetical protein
MRPTETFGFLGSARGGPATLCTAETGSRDAVGLQCRKNAPFTLKVTSLLMGASSTRSVRLPGGYSNVGSPRSKGLTGSGVAEQAEQAGFRAVVETC